MSPRELAFCILLISTVRFSRTLIIRPQRLLITRSLESVRNLEDVPDKWRTMHPFKVPQIEIQLIKRHVSPDEKWFNEYKYSRNDAAKVTSKEKKILQIENGDIEAREKDKENGVQDNIVMPDMFIPQIGSRNIITVPTYCPEGQRQDSRGRCRTIIM